MKFISSGSEDDFNGSLLPSERGYSGVPQQSYVVPGAQAAAPSESVETFKFDIVGLLRKHWLLLASLMVLGVAAGFSSVVLSSPMYKSRLLLEVQDTSGGLQKAGGGTSAETTEIDIQTQVNILRGETFLKRGAERMQSETVPLPTTGRDIFSRLRQRIHPATQDPLEAAKVGLNVAVRTFDARPVNRTKLIELTCESTSPDVAAQFLNSMASEFVDQSSRDRMQTAQRTAEWLAGQIEDTKSRVQEAEEKVQAFVRSSGNVFTGADNATLDDTKLAQLKAELAKIQQERIFRETRYELTQNNPPQTLAEVLDDSVLRGYQGQLESLKRERAALTTTYTSKYDKVRKVDAQIETLQKAYDNELASTVKRIKNDYDASLKQEKLLNAAYASQASRVGGEQGNAAQYNALRHDVDTLRAEYQSLLMQQNEAQLGSSVPISPMLVVEPSIVPDRPYKPQPVLNISFGAVFGLVLAGGLVILRENMDRSIKSPGLSRRMFNVPELGVIPNLGATLIPAAKNGRLNGHGLAESQADPTTALITWQSGPAFIMESFRGTLASILRNHAIGKPQKMILITSPGPAEGKTTVVHNLGIALAETGRKVLLVDGDFRRPHLHRKFSLPNEWGLIDLLCDDRPLDEYPPEMLGVFTGLPGLTVLPNRVSSNNISKALYSARLREILEFVGSRYDMVLVDAPPILSVADTRIMAPLTDALILVLRCGVTNREAAMEAYERIQEDGLSLLGTVLTDYDLTADRRRQYYYDYDDRSRA
jgi:polysaccharide biosynthesis transport protein